MARLRRIIYLLVGLVSVILGIVGIFLPLLPTTPFLLLAMFCFLRSSPRCYRWLMENRWLGIYIKNYLAGHGIPRREKILILALLWSTIVLSACTIVNSWWLRLLLAAIAVGVTWHIVRMKTMAKKPRPGSKTKALQKTK